MSSNGLDVTWNFKVLHILLVFWILCLGTVAALFEGCDHTYNIEPGYSYLESPYYPETYPRRTSCRYKFIAPLDHYITLNCTINLPTGPKSCTTEFFYVAKDGDSLLRDSEELCGNGTFIRKSLFRSVVLAYASYGSQGSFRCQLRVRPQKCDCGWSISTRIVNGKEASINEYPSMVALKDTSTNLLSYCAGVIVSHKHILSAAHCYYTQSNPAYVKALVGYHNLKNRTKTKYAASYSISKIIVHSGYTNDPVNNDIAIYVTKYNIEWSRAVGPICLPPSQNAKTDFAYNEVDVIGWGTTSFAGPTSNTLQKITLMVTDYKTCMKSYAETTTIYKSQICTYDYSGASRDSCQYDSGGPVILKLRRQFLLGIISFGKICGQGGFATGVNTRITSYLDWIHKNTRNTMCTVDM